MDSDSKERGAGDLWELTIDDLFSTSDAAASELHAAVPGPYTIDLCDSIEPATEIAPSLRDFELLQVYQVTDWKDDRLVFRLRLGPIDSELEADAILSIVRRDYPGAVALPMGDDDLRMIAIAAAAVAPRGSKAKADAAEQPAKVAKIAKVEKTASTVERDKPAIAASPAKPAPPGTGVVPPTPPAAGDGAVEPIDFSTAFRDLATELLALDPEPTRPAAKSTKDPAAAPPVLTAAITGKHATLPAAGRMQRESPARAPVGAPPVLKIDDVARPPRERAELRAVQAGAGPRAVAPAAAVASASSAKAMTRGVTPAIAANAAPASGATTASPPAPGASRPTPTQTGATSTSVAPMKPFAATPPAATTATPLAQTKPPAPTVTSASVNDPSAAVGTARPVASTTVTPAPTVSQSARRDPLPASSPIAPAARAASSSTSAAPSVPAPVERASRPQEPPRVALRSKAATPEPVASQAMPMKAPAAPPAGPVPPAALTLAPEMRRDSTPVAPAATTARLASPAPESDLELELLPNDLETTTPRATSPTTGAATATAAAPAKSLAVGTSTIALELVPDEPRTPPAASPQPAAPLPAAPSALPVAPKAAPAHAAKSPAPVAPAPPVASGAAKAQSAKSTATSSAAPTRKAAVPERPRVNAPPASTPVAATPMPVKAAASPAAAPAKTAAPQKAAPAAAPKAAERSTPPPIDSTQTLRVLVVPKDPAAPTEKLIVIQLVLSEQEIVPESVPDLAIFKEYRLYSAVGYEQGKIMHALRLGFFSDEGPAEAVAGYLRSYFDAPVVTRISVEERERFARRRVAARKDSGDTGVHTAIELASAPSAPSTSLADLRTQSGHGRSRG